MVVSAASVAVVLAVTAASCSVLTSPSFSEDTVAEAAEANADALAWFSEVSAAAADDSAACCAALASVDAVVVFSSGTSGYLIFGSQSAKTVNVKQLSYWFENVPDSIAKIFGDIMGCISQARITSDVQIPQSIKNETEEGTEVV